MTRHLTDAELTAYRASRTRTPDPQQLLQLDRHLAECGECSSRLNAMAAPALPPEIAEALPEAFPNAAGLHPSYEQLCAYIDGQWGEERTRVQQHLKLCRACAAEVNDLREFDHNMAAKTASEVAAEPSAATLASGWRQWWSRLFDPSLRPRFSLASAALLLIGVAVMTRVEFLNPQDIASRAVEPGAAQGPGGVPVQFYFGLAAAVLGLAGLIYRLRK